MPPRGRKPTPTHLKDVQGNPGHRPLPEDEPEIPAPSELPAPPEHLDVEACREWNRTGSLLLNSGLLTELDVGALAVYCAAYSRWVDAEERIRLHGPIVEAPGTGYPSQSPYLQIANTAMAQMLKIQAEFGMTPSSRTRVRPAKVPDAARDPLEKYIGGKG